MTSKGILNLWEKIHSESNLVYGLSPIYDDLISEGYFNYLQSASSLRKIIGEPKQRKKVLELAVGTGRVAALLANDYMMFGVDHSLEMIDLLRIRFNTNKIKINIQLNTLSSFSFRHRFDCIYTHSADPIIFWKHGQNIILAINSRAELKAIMLNCHRHLKKKGRLCINIENQHPPFPKRFKVELFQVESGLELKKIYQVFDKQTGHIHYHITKKEKPCSLLEINEYAAAIGYSDANINKDQTFIWFQKY